MLSASAATAHSECGIRGVGVHCADALGGRDGTGDDPELLVSICEFGVRALERVFQDAERFFKNGFGNREVDVAVGGEVQRPREPGPAGSAALPRRTEGRILHAAEWPRTFGRLVRAAQRPAPWASEDGLDDGLENFFVAGAGLGSLDESGNRVTLLGRVPDVVALRWAGIGLLVGRQVCAVVYAGEIESGAATDLGGANLGVVAFDVTSVDAAAVDWPNVTVQVLDARETCSGVLAAFSEAPSEP